MKRTFGPTVVLCLFSTVSLFSQSHVTPGTSYTDSALPGATFTVECKDYGNTADSSGTQRAQSSWAITSVCPPYKNSPGHFTYEFGKPDGTNITPSTWQNYQQGSATCPSGNGQTPQGYVETVVWGSCSEKQYIIIKGIPRG